jgi:hypothetical protein
MLLVAVTAHVPPWHEEGMGTGMGTGTGTGARTGTGTGVIMLDCRNTLLDVCLNACLCFCSN